MKNPNDIKLELLKGIGKLSKAIDDEVDWYIASFQEKDPKRRALSRNIFYQKQKERINLAKETYERSK